MCEHCLKEWQLCSFDDDHDDGDDNDDGDDGDDVNDDDGDDNEENSFPPKIFKSHYLIKLGRFSWEKNEPRSFLIREKQFSVVSIDIT